MLWVLATKGECKEGTTLKMSDLNFKQYAWAYGKGIKVNAQFKDFGVTAEYREIDDNVYNIELTFDDADESKPTAYAAQIFATWLLKRCDGLGIIGISPHSYRYAWAERAKKAGMGERDAMQALGHQSKAIHRAYAKKARLRIPSLEELERQSREKIVPFINIKKPPEEPPQAAVAT